MSVVLLRVGCSEPGQDRPSRYLALVGKPVIIVDHAELGAGPGPGPTLMSTNHQNAPAILPGGGANVRQVGLPV